MTQLMEFAVATENAKERLDVWLLVQFADGLQSRASVQRWIKGGFVTRVEGPSPILEANPARKVRAGEIYRVDLPELEATTMKGQDIPLNVVFEDEHLIVIDKPVGLTVHPGAGNPDGTLANALLHHCGDSLSGINGEMRPGIVHRIDKDTSGLLVAAKNDVVHRGLGKLFARHDIHRVYLAVVKGKLARSEGTIEGNIGRHPTARVRRAVVAEGGKPAVTHWKVMERFGDLATLVECRLETGRTHQIRVHMAHIGHFLLGDPLYGGTVKGLETVEIPHRQMLHAAELGFVHPITGKKLVFKSPLPDDMAGVLTQLRDIQ